MTFVVSINALDMSVHCTKCGEELLGSVNRCWRCGSTFTPHQGDPGIPPVRQRPPAVPHANVAQVGDELVHGQDLTNAEPFTGDTSTQRPNRRGSPFADSHVISAKAVNEPSQSEFQLAPKPTEYPRHAASIGGAIGSLVLGVFSVVGMLLSPSGALVISMLGIPLGLWGLYSDHRAIAIAGLVLCVIALAIAGFLCAVFVFEQIYDYNPFDVSPLREEDDPGDFSLIDPRRRRTPKCAQRSSFLGQDVQ